MRILILSDILIFNKLKTNSGIVGGDMFKNILYRYRLEFKGIKLSESWKKISNREKIFIVCYILSVLIFLGSIVFIIYFNFYNAYIVYIISFIATAISSFFMLKERNIKDRKLIETELLGINDEIKKETDFLNKIYGEYVLSDSYSCQKEKEVLLTDDKKKSQFLRNLISACDIEIETIESRISINKKYSSSNILKLILSGLIVYLFIEPVQEQISKMLLEELMKSNETFTILIYLIVSLVALIFAFFVTYELALKPILIFFDGNEKRKKLVLQFKQLLVSYQ